MLLRLLKNLVSPTKSSHNLNGFDDIEKLKRDGELLQQQRFSEALLADFFKFMHTRTEDNFDHYRYGYDGVDYSNTFNTGIHIAQLQQYFHYTSEYFSIYSLLKDEGSKELFRRLILYRLLGHLHVYIKDGVTWKNETALLEAGKKFVTRDSALQVGGLFGKMYHHEGIPLPQGGHIALDCWSVNITYTVLKQQYYFSRNGVEIAPEKGDVILDLGACFGDTAVFFANTVGPDGHVYAFDPLPSHNQVINFNIQQNNLNEIITAIPCAVGDQVVTVDTDSKNNSQNSMAMANPGFSMLSKDADFPVTTLDDFVEKNQLNRVDFIKMDIEGFELPALIGAKGVIERYKPKLAISLYHKPLDLIEIPHWLAENFPDYEMYLDHYTIHQEETVLYAICRNRH